MKELSIEEKAKAYDKALELARVAAFNGHQSLMEGIFPELKESEDERIRERLIEFFKDWGKTRSHCWSISISDILAWLEKLGEQKPNDMLAWSEGDDVLLSSVINSLLIFEDSGAGKMKIDWLKSLKQRIKKEAV